jgi:hypothetical protein
VVEVVVVLPVVVLVPVVDGAPVVPGLLHTHSPKVPSGRQVLCPVHMFVAQETLVPGAHGSSAVLSSLEQAPMKAPAMTASPRSKIVQRFMGGSMPNALSPHRYELHVESRSLRAAHAPAP